MRDFSESSGIDRRSLLAGAGAALAASAVGASPALGHGRKGHGHGDHGGRGSIPRENISIQLYTLRSLPLEEQLKGLAQIGYKTVEHAGFGELTAAQFKAALRKYGLKATSGHQGIPQPWDEAAWRKQVADAVTVGQRNIVNPASPITFFPPDNDLSRSRACTTVDGVEGLRGRPQQGGRDRPPVRAEVRLPQPLLGVAGARRTTRR